MYKRSLPEKAMWARHPRIYGQTSVAYPRPDPILRQKRDEGLHDHGQGERNLAKPFGITKVRKIFENLRNCYK